MDCLILFHEFCVLKILHTLFSSLEHFFHYLVVIVFAAVGIGLVAQALRDFYLNEEIFHLVLVELVEHVLEVNDRAFADNEVILYV